MTISRLTAVLICGMALALGACTETRTVRIGEDTLEAERQKTAAAETALADLRDSLAAATNPERRPEAREKLNEGRDNLRDNLPQLPENVRTVLMVVDNALGAVIAALDTTNTAFGSGGTVSFDSAHTSLDQAQAALDAAQTQITAALEANPTDAVETVLLQAQGLLTTAQVSLVPLLREELAEARARPPAAPEPPTPTAEEEALRSAQTGLTAAQAATGQAGTALAAAQAALEKAEADFQATAAAWDGDTTDERKTADREAAQTRRQAAQTALAAAQTAFVNAREAERTAAAALATAAASALAAAATDDQRTEADAGAAAAMAAETATRAWAATRIAADPGLAAPPSILNQVPPGQTGGAPFTARVTLTPREAAFADCTVNMPCPNPNGLDIQTEAVAWAAGKTVLSPAATGESDHFPLRAVSMRGDIRPSPEGATDDEGGATPKIPVVQGATTDTDGNAITPSGSYQRHYLNPVTSSVRFTPDGMVFRTGGEGAVMSLFKHDLDRSSSRGRDGINSPGAWGTQDSGNNVMSDDCSGAYPAYCYDFNRSDAEISWGAPYADPDGEPNYYWASRYGLSGNQPQPDPEDSDGRRLAAHGALGDLRVWLSNHGGLDAGADADDAGDDADRYLSYAAYGLFMYTDYIDEYPRPGLLQGFHFGYDAFRDADDAKTTDRATSIEATFRGRTMGMILHPRSNSVGSESAPHVLHFARLRGDVTLNACIGAGACTGEGIPTGANKIMGNVANLQALENGIWQKNQFLRNGGDGHSHEGFAILLAEGDIAADGSYTGHADPWDTSWNKGEYGGALYGPADKLETAGWWRIETDSTHQNRRVAAFGSFGACQAEECRVTAPSN